MVLKFWLVDGTLQGEQFFNHEKHEKTRTFVLFVFFRC